MKQIHYLFIILALFSFTYSQNYHWPTIGSKAMSSNFGEFRDGGYHMGIDIKTLEETGWPVYAVDDGYISRMSNNFSGYGKGLYLTLNDGNVAVYAHLEEFAFRLETIFYNLQEKNNSYIVNEYFLPEQFPFKKGDIIGYTGNTGASFGPHLHFELRNNKSQPINPLINGLNIEDYRNPRVFQIGVIPLSTSSKINGSSIPRVYPLYAATAGGGLELPDTVSCFGPIGIAIEIDDKIQGAKNKYQVQSIQLLVDDQNIFSLNYSKLDYDEKSTVNQTRENRFHRLNLGSFTKLYKLKTFSNSTIVNAGVSGILNLTPGYHKVEIQISDASGNTTRVKGTFINYPPVKIAIRDVEWNDSTIEFNIQPVTLNIPLTKISCYSYTAYGYPDEELTIIKSKKDRSGIRIQLPKSKLGKHGVSFIVKNKLGVYGSPLTWHDPNAERRLTEMDVDITFSSIEHKLIAQVKTNGFTSGNTSLRILKEDEYISIPLTKIQPTVYTSDLLLPSLFTKTKRIDAFFDGEIERIIQVNLDPIVASPSKQTSIVSNDKNCSIQITNTSLYDTSLVWIEKINHPVEPKGGTRLSSVYQLQPFELALKDTIRIGIRYSNHIKNMKNISLYYYNQKDGWTFLPSSMHTNRQVIASTLFSLDAITIMQDIEPPFIRKVYPENRGRFHYKDLKTISVIADDYLSGLNSDEKSMNMKLDDIPVRYAFQPIKKELSYYLPTPLEAGEHTMEYKISDQAGNIISGMSTFMVD
ncbi:MAG: M23 family metallopeptidase [Candidatus Neomarinimicrobiota bacterium]|nr:M23 family metallopeptidase [Candidatus Neomarinimicrobiota bacterium]